jgi:MarR family
MKLHEPQGDARSTRTWGFLTNHSHVLLCIARDPQARARDIAAQVGITERATQRILADLIADGYVTRTKVGRRHHYKINQPRRRAPPPRLAGPLDRIPHRSPQHGRPADTKANAASAPPPLMATATPRCGRQRDACE